MYGDKVLDCWVVECFIYVVVGVLDDCCEICWYYIVFILIFCVNSIVLLSKKNLIYDIMEFMLLFYCLVLFIDFL